VNAARLKHGAWSFVIATALLTLLYALGAGCTGAEGLPDAELEEAPVAPLYVDCDGGTHDMAPDFGRGGNPGCGMGGERGR